MELKYDMEMGLEFSPQNLKLCWEGWFADSEERDRESSEAGAGGQRQQEPRGMPGTWC